MVPNPPPMPVPVPVEEAPFATRWLSPFVANVWSLLTACGLGALDLIYALLGYYHGSPESALLRGMLWCSLPQAVAAALALLLARRRRHSSRALSFVAIVAAAVNHCMYAGFVGVAFATYTGKVLIAIFGYATVFLLAVGDVMGFLSHLLGEDEED